MRTGRPPKKDCDYAGVFVHRGACVWVFAVSAWLDILYIATTAEESKILIDSKLCLYSVSAATMIGAVVYVENQNWRGAVCRCKTV